MRLLASGALIAALAVCAPGLGKAGTAHHSQRFLIATKINAGLIRSCSSGWGGCALRGQGFVMEAVGYQLDLNPGFIVGASFTESSGGDAPLSKYDIWGWYSMPSVSNWHDAFVEYANFIHGRWPGATTPWQLYGYCACGASAWGNRTSSWMERFGFAPSLPYPGRNK